MLKKWRLKPRAPQEFLEGLPEYPQIIKQILYSRGINTEAKMNQFLNPDYDQDLYDPFLFLDMRKAVKRIFQALQKQEKIMIYGDYDVDGVTGALILYNTLKFLGSKNTNFYLPDRDTEGYGLNPRALKNFIKSKINLVITVDCGISTVKEVQEAQENKIDVIITDHHTLAGQAPPPAYAVIHARRREEKYPYKDLAGAGVAFKLSQALLQSRESLDYLKKEKGKDFSKEQIRSIASAFEKWLLDLTALGTIADCAPLLGENRTLVKYGLVVLNKTLRPGLRILIEKSGLKLGKINAWNIAFQIAPRINSAGRMDHANTAFYLLSAKKKDYIKKLADKLEKQNQERQSLVERSVKQAWLRFQKEPQALIFLEKDKKWPIGVCGLIASRLVELTSRPCFIGEEKQEIIKCSARSTPAFNLIQAIQKCKKYLQNFGGHAQAAGFSVLPQNWDKFAAKIKKIAEQRLTKKDLVPLLEIDSEIKAQEINWELYDWLQKCEPFGTNNSQPLFLIHHLDILEIKRVGREESHLKLRLCESAQNNPRSCRILDAIGFSMGKKAESVKKGDKISLVFKLEVNEWNGRRDLQMKVIDLKLEKN